MVAALFVLYRLTGGDEAVSALGALLTLLPYYAVLYALRGRIKRRFSFQIETTDGPCRGQSVVDAYNFYRHKPNAYILTKVNVLGFFELFLSTILNKSPEELLRLSALLKEDSHD